MKVAALDLGTNSFLCLIAEVSDGIIETVYSDEVKVVRLGQDVNRTKMFQPEALGRARECLSEFSKAIHHHKPDKVLAMATSAARDVSNGSELFKICQDLQIPIEIIPGEREAEITFAGATAHLPPDGKSRLVIDVGGGSTEYILGKDRKVLISESKDIGCVRLTEKFIRHYPTPNHELRELAHHIREETIDILAKIKKFGVDEVIAVAGTPTSIAAAEIGGFDEKKVDNYLLSANSLHGWIHKLAELNVDDRVAKFKIEKGRADVLPVGAMILWLALDTLGIERLKVSTKGVRYGVALEIWRRTQL